MGYESRLYVVDKNNKTMHDEINGKKMYYANLICEFDMGKCYSISDIMRNYPATNSYIFSDDGHTEIVEDKYGEPLKEIPIEDAVNIIENAINKDKDKYIFSCVRRYLPLFATLKTLKADEKSWHELVVLHYGY